MASSKPSTAMCRPPSAKPKATEPSEISKLSSTSSPVTSWPIHPLEIATSPVSPRVSKENASPQNNGERGVAPKYNQAEARRDGRHAGREPCVPIRPRLRRRPQHPPIHVENPIRRASEVGPCAVEAPTGGRI